MNKRVVQRKKWIEKFEGEKKKLVKKRNDLQALMKLERKEILSLETIEGIEEENDAKVHI